ncbi:MAG: hypothetical protein HOV94_35685 [Saccharothrix sp.]|nr:hypothetical protein [Saccharothrix sp.]
MKKALTILSATLAVSAASALAACTDSATTANQSTTTPGTAGATTADGTATGTATGTKEECANVAEAMRTAATEVGRFLSGQVGIDQVRYAADELSDAVAAADSAISADARQQWDEAKDALGRARDALKATPVDGEAVRSNVNEALGALDDAVHVCAPDVGALPESVSVEPTTPSS